MLTPHRCQEIFSIVAKAATSAGVRDLEVILGESAEALTRFANNTIHQNVAERSYSLSVRPVIDHRTARANTNRLDADSIQRVVEQAISITRSVEQDPELLPLLEPTPAPRIPRFADRTAEASPEDRARAVHQAIRIAESASQTAAGIYSTEASVEAIYNSRGLANFHSETMARFSITTLAADSSGWAKASAVDLADLDPRGLAEWASRKAVQSAAPRELPPGRYTVVLEPAAVLDLVGQMFGDFSATAMADQRSFLTDRLGKQLFGSNINIFDDVAHLLQSGAPFDGEGMPRQRLTLVEAGVAREVARSRLAGGTPTGHGFPLPNEYGEAPANLVIAGGDKSLEEMIASTERGILVTRLWYIREVDPYEKIMTGMTRDGTFLIEGGEVTSGLKNFRFNQGLVEMLKNVVALSSVVRASGEETFDMVVPAMKVEDFQFTEVTRF